MTFTKFHCISVNMKYDTEELLTDIEDYLLERYEEPEQVILF